MSNHRPSLVSALGTRWLGVGLAALISVVTLGLALTGQMALYINPESAWFAVGMAVLALIGAIASFALPLGAEADHGHDHGDAPRRSESPTTSEQAPSVMQAVASNPGVPLTRSAARAARAQEESATHEPAEDHHDHSHGERSSRRAVGLLASIVGGVAATAVVGAALILPPATLSAELAMSRDTGTAPLFANADAVQLAAAGDTSKFGVSEWATVFSTATSPDTYVGTPVTLVGFVTPAADSAEDLKLSRLVVTHCVIDAQPAALPVTEATGLGSVSTGTWIQVEGTIEAGADGALVLAADSVTPVDEPADPYEY